MSLMSDLIDRVQIDEDCWLWTGSKQNGGYGTMWAGGRVRTTHRVAYEVFNGEIPNGLLVCHKCDNRACVNPAHLFVGTHKDNAMDMAKKGRCALQRAGMQRPRGESHPKAKLSYNIAKLIRCDLARNESQLDVARKYGVSQATVSRVKNRSSIGGWDE